MPSERFIAEKDLPKPVDTTAQVQCLQNALAKRKKQELLEALIELARGDRKTLRKLESRFDVESPLEDVVAATRQAIADATAFDERRINYNFNYDDDAYEAIERNLTLLVDAGAFDVAMELALELMRDGSYQVEMSDEGLMTDDIADCLKVVIRGIEQAKLPNKSVVDWCNDMSHADCVGFVCDEELDSLRKRLEQLEK